MGTKRILLQDCKAKKKCQGQTNAMQSNKASTKIVTLTYMIQRSYLAL
jgi:hypothetical protein